MSERQVFHLVPPEGATTKPILKWHPLDWFIPGWTVYMPCGIGYRGTGMSFESIAEAYQYALRWYDRKDTN